MKFKRKEGFALMTILAVMVILSILFVSIITITQSNTKQIIVQEDNLRAYYLARSGIDIAYASLMENNEENYVRFLNDNKQLEHKNLALPNEDNAVGYVDIEVLEGEEEVRIRAIARTKNGDGKSKLSLYIDKSNITRTRWVKE